VRARHPRARLIALPLHQQHHRDGGAAARLLRGRQHRQDRGLQPGADAPPRRADRRRAAVDPIRGAPRRRAGAARRVSGTRYHPQGENTMTHRPMTRRSLLVSGGGAAAALAMPGIVTRAHAEDFGSPELIAAAKKEGRLVYYTANFAEVEQEVIKAFNKR